MCEHGLPQDECSMRQADTALAAWAADAMCECEHDRRYHDGECGATASSGRQCSCPSFKEASDV